MPNPQAGDPYDHVSWPSSIWKLRLNSWTGIAFANGNKEPAKGRQGGTSNAESCRSAWACGHCSHGCACRRRGAGVRGIPDHRYRNFGIGVRTSRAANCHFQDPEGGQVMTEKWKEEGWAQDFWYSGKVTRRTPRGLGWRRDRRVDAGTGTVARGIRRGSAIQDRFAATPVRRGCTWRENRARRFADGGRPHQ